MSNQYQYPQQYTQELHPKPAVHFNEHVRVNMSYSPNNVISVETETYLCCSIINTLFCFFWLGIPAIICSCQAKDRYDFGDINGGRSSANTAKTLNIIGFVLGGICWLIGIIILILVFTGFGIFSSTIFG